VTIRIAVYGGTNLSPRLVRFTRRLTRALVRFADVVLVSGGFRWFESREQHVSVDVAVLTEAKLRIDPRRFRERFETWLPAKRLDRPSDDVVRFEDGSVHRVPGTDQACRFELVKAVDALVTIAGEGNTRTVLELALALNKPALPVPFTGGDSREVWRRNGRDFIEALNLEPRLVSELESRDGSPARLDRLAEQIAKAVHAGARRSCLVLMPFGPVHDGFYVDVLRHAVTAANYVPHRIDKDDYAGNIPALFRASLERAGAVVVDLTGTNPNVMYELGQVHARGMRPFMIFRRRRGESLARQLPFYLRQEKIVGERDDEAGRRRIARELREYLESLARSFGARDV